VREGSLGVLILLIIAAGTISSGQKSPVTDSINPDYDTSGKWRFPWLMELSAIPNDAAGFPETLLVAVTNRGMEDIYGVNMVFGLYLPGEMLGWAIPYPGHEDTVHLTPAEKAIFRIPRDSLVFRNIDGSAADFPQIEAKFADRPWVIVCTVSDLYLRKPLVESSHLIRSNQLKSPKRGEP
jgi:hypothetical protein